MDGKASHAGAAPDKGVNALYELSHQLLQLSDLSRRDQGLKPELDGVAGRHQPQRDPGAGQRARRREGAESV